MLFTIAVSRYVTFADHTGVQSGEQHLLATFAIAAHDPAVRTLHNRHVAEIRCPSEVSSVPVWVSEQNALRKVQH